MENLIEKSGNLQIRFVKSVMETLLSPLNIENQQNWLKIAGRGEFYDIKERLDED